MAMIRVTRSRLWDAFVDSRDSEDILRLNLGMSEVDRKFVRRFWEESELLKQQTEPFNYRNG